MILGREIAAFLVASFITLLATPPAHAAPKTSCYVVGDSIAKGTATFLPQCQSDTKVGINTKDALSRFQSIPHADTTVISLGINDSGTMLPTKHNLEKMRARVSSNDVVWILPSHADKKADVQSVASEHHDKTMNVDIFISEDHIHPTWHGYQTIAHELALND